MNRTEVVSVYGLGMVSGLLLGAGVAFGDLGMAVAGGVLTVIMLPWSIWAVKRELWAS